MKTLEASKNSATKEELKKNSSKTESSKNTDGTNCLNRERRDRSSKIHLSAYLTQYKIQATTRALTFPTTSYIQVDGGPKPAGLLGQIHIETQNQ